MNRPPARRRGSRFSGGSDAVGRVLRDWRG